MAQEQNDGSITLNLSGNVLCDGDYFVEKVPVTVSDVGFMITGINPKTGRITNTKPNMNVYNTSPLPGVVKSITIKVRSGHFNMGQIKLYTRNEMVVPASGSYIVGEGHGTYKWELPEESQLPYFRIQSSSDAVTGEAYADEIVIEYGAATGEQPTASPDPYVSYSAIVAKYGDKYYAAANTELSSKKTALDALEVTVLDGCVVNVEEQDKERLSWTVTSETNSSKVVTHCKPYNSTKELRAVKDKTDFTYDTGTSTTELNVNTRSIIYSNGTGFKYYAKTNIGKSGYSSDYTLMPFVTMASINHSRTNISANSLGTVCLPYDVQPTAFNSARENGFIFYTISGKVLQNNVPKTLVLEETEELKAGVPYVFYCENNASLSLDFMGNSTDEPQEVNGLIGTFERLPFSGLADYEEGDVFVFTNNEVRAASSNSGVEANRAYLRMSRIPEYNAAGFHANIRTISLTDDNTTGIGSVSEMSEESKPVFYDITGRVGKSDSKGLRIIKGKKYICK